MPFEIMLNAIQYIPSIRLIHHSRPQSSHPTRRPPWVVTNPIIIIIITNIIITTITNTFLIILYNNNNNYNKTSADQSRVTSRSRPSSSDPWAETAPSQGRTSWTWHSFCRKTRVSTAPISTSNLHLWIRLLPTRSRPLKKGFWGWKSPAGRGDMPRVQTNKPNSCCPQQRSWTGVRGIRCQGHNRLSRNRNLASSRVPTIRDFIYPNLGAQTSWQCQGRPSTYQGVLSLWPASRTTIPPALHQGAPAPIRRPISDLGFWGLPQYASQSWGVSEIIILLEFYNFF